MSDFYIPPPQISARIRSYDGAHVLNKGPKGRHDRTGEYTSIAQASSSSDSDDQYWTFEHAGGNVCLVRNKTMGKVMLINSDHTPSPFYLVDGSLEGSASACR